MGSRVGSLVLRRSTETISYKRQTGHSSSGDASFGSLATMTARIERTTNETGDLDGRRVTGRGKLFTTEELMLGDVVWLPEDDTADLTQSARVESVATMRNLEGVVTHYEVTLS
jgi:hypothetical protein